MSELRIELDRDKAACAPGEMVSGRVRWSVEGNPESVELSLLWHTSGKGTRDVGVVETLKWETPGASNVKDFSFALPGGPYSFSGRLISLVWILELTVFPDRRTEKRELILSPTGSEILLNR